MNDGSSQEHLRDLVRTLQLENLSLDLSNYQRDLPLDVSRIDSVSINGTRWLSSDTLLNLHPQKILFISNRNDLHTTNGQIFEIIEGNSKSHGCTTWIFQHQLSLSEFSDFMQIFGDRAKFIESTKCWSLTDGKSNNPTSWISYSASVIQLLDRKEFEDLCNSV